MKILLNVFRDNEQILVQIDEVIMRELVIHDPLKVDDRGGAVYGDLERRYQPTLLIFNFARYFVLDVTRGTEIEVVDVNVYVELVCKR